MILSAFHVPATRIPSNSFSRTALAAATAAYARVGAEKAPKTPRAGFTKVRAAFPRDMTADTNVGTVKNYHRVVADGKIRKGV